MAELFNMAAYVLHEGAAHPDKAALAVIGPARAERWSYARLIAAVRGTATGFLQAGLRPGDRVLMRLGNHPSFPIAYLGAIAAGLVPVPTSAMLTAPEITHIAHEIEPALIVAGEGIALPAHPAPILPEAALQGFAELPAAPWHMGDADRLGYIVYTSGSSGHARAVMHAHRAIRARRLMFAGWYDLQAADRLLHAGAFNWTFTLGTGLMDPWTLGATALIPAAGVEPQQLPLLAKRHGATIIAGAPGIFRRMLRAEWPTWDSLRHGLTAGERLDPALRRLWQQRTGTDLHEAMGMSECSTFLSGSPARPAPEGTAGYPQPGRQIAILGPDGTPVSFGSEGQLAIHSSDEGLCLGYMNAADETAARYRGAWFLTGDFARADADGAISVLGRTDDLMNAGGLRVAPAEIEEKLAAVPDAGEVAVAEIMVAPATTVIAAFWTGPATQGALKTAVEAGLARYKQPREYIHLDSLPRTATGKINRRALREQHARHPGGKDK